ncbi:hypothetical protein OQJ18_06940 [Fluoribacter dumoffii]|uniref:hypothetical protein n=1 Tax=Fluoribacter dumoffii TaxID=463 RepID=UPI002243F149|nr:hypothetical protein [Fluoribacter dumoffii]MCW8418172.1 hypothetical protein [Fluoribacter dumoffii]MCW8453986.1 hypothetical protein [Fluoribacter dumoffii]MCW8461943.1 hypothetical protein [Fluoribacter dumoffii]MCW8482155.1 hypothetical protein [Fluoribacter dumoffii]
MFLKKFPENLLIKKIKISGPFISVYVPEDELENFQQKYQGLIKRYSVLSIGEGMMHDYAHYTHNKNLSFFTGKKSDEKNEHFHFILPAIANEANLNTFLSFFEDKDLSHEQKQALLKEFREYSTTPSLKTSLEQINSYKYTLYALLYKDPYLTKIMPLFSEFVRKLEPYLGDNPDEPVNIDPSIKLKVGGHQVSARDADLNLSLFINHIEILSSLSDIIEKLEKQGKEAVSSDTINELNQLFESASKKPLPNFSAAPYLFNEMVAHFPFLDGNLNNLYLMLKQQLESTLETDQLVFNPQVINLPSEDIAYTQAIFFLSKQGNIGLQIMDTMARLQEGKKSLNPYWINSGSKLQGIVNAVLSLEKTGDDLKQMALDPHSELYLALNKQRLLPLTFLGSFAVNKSKTLIKVEDEITHSPTCS